MLLVNPQIYSLDQTCLLDQISDLHVYLSNETFQIPYFLRKHHLQQFHNVKSHVSSWILLDFRKKKQFNLVVVPEFCTTKTQQ